MTAARDDDFMALPGMEADSTDTHHGRERLSDEAAPTSSDTSANTSPNASSKSALDALLDEYRARAKSEREKGTLFEELTRQFLLHDARFAHQFKEIYLWNEWPERRTGDTGIDLVAVPVDPSAGPVAIQCKFYALGHRIQKADIDSFLSASGKEPFGRRIVVDTSGAPWGKNAQDAHEAIRPTSIERTPEEAAPFLTADQLKLYTLIWQRFVACQMSPAIYDTLSVLLTAGARYQLRASGSQLKFAGFTAIYDGPEGKKEKDVVLPEMAAGDVLDTMNVLPQQHFTEPPPRYNEASLVKTLEEKGIGRPSTYAPIIETILARGYVIRMDKQFHPTELGFVVVDMLEEYFKNIVDVKFTANMETELDEIADGKLTKNRLLEDFYGPFEKTLEKADEAIGHVEMPVEVSDVPCELCGRMMVVKQGRYGKFLACPGFPECRNTKPILKETGAKCPKCGGSIVERRTRRGRFFYGCRNYPACDFVTWDQPQAEPCPKCGALVLKHHFKNGRALTYCYNDSCETRVDHPINRELERLRRRAEKAESGDPATDKAKTAANKTKKAAGKERTEARAAGKKTTAKKAAAKKTPAKKTAAKKTAARKKA